MESVKYSYDKNKDLVLKPLSNNFANQNHNGYRYYLTSEFANYLHFTYRIILSYSPHEYRHCIIKNLNKWVKISNLQILSLCELSTTSIFNYIIYTLNLILWLYLYTSI